MPSSSLNHFLTLEPSSGDMTREAVSASFYHSPVYDKDYPRLQILTVKQLLAGDESKMPVLT
jgi:hypothetical protein